MFRYLAMCWSRSNEAEALCAHRLSTKLTALSSDWKMVFRGPGICVYTFDETAGACSSIPLQGCRGIVLGTLFERADASNRDNRVRSFEPDEGTRIVRTAGRRLIDRYWGRYVAFIQNPDTYQLWIIRDPTGALPCLRVEIDGIQIFVADIEDCCDLRASNFPINWAYVRARMLVPYVQTSATGLTGVSQLLPGSCLELNEDACKESLYWHPCQVAGSAVIESGTEAAEELRRVVTRSIHAWASCHKAIVLKLSGGLDSAIVLGCLATAPQRPHVICANDYSQGADTDERYYARLAAERASCVLIERARDPAADLSRSLEFRRVSAPIPSHFWVGTHPTNEELAVGNSATALFTGNGGDQLFLAAKGHWPLVDFMYCHGLHPNAIRIARDASYMEPPARCESWWSLMRKGIRLGLLAKRAREPLHETPDYSEQTIIAREAIQAFTSERRSWLPPWLHGTCSLPPGKIAQVYRLSFPNSFYPISRSQADALEPVHPLLSQPIVELCLRTRTYALMSGTTDRTAARRAFEQVIPAEIARRRSKGGIDDYAIELLFRNVHFVRDFLLDGELMHHQLLNRSVLESTLGGAREGLELGTYQILDLLQVEAWVRAWTAPVTRRASDATVPVAATQH